VPSRFRSDSSNSSLSGVKDQAQTRRSTRAVGDQPGLSMLPAMSKTNLQDSFDQIEAVIADLESGELPLEQAFGRYEQGLKRLQEARRQLDRYQRRFEELRSDDGDHADTE
jgi:exodeoxyribonuclease VII small subunit